MDEKTRKKIFAVVFILFVFSVSYRIMNPYTPKRVSRLTYTSKGLSAKDLMDKSDLLSENLNHGKNQLSPSIHEQENNQNKNAGKQIGKTGKGWIVNKEAHYSDEVFTRYFNRQPLSRDVIRDIFLLKSDEKPEQSKSAQVFQKKTNPEPVNIIPKVDPVKKVIDYITSFTFLGSYESGSRKAIFLSKNKLVLVARIGDRINGKYLMEEINEDKIRIKALDINETIHIDIKEFNDDE